MNFKKIWHCTLALIALTVAGCADNPDLNSALLINGKFYTLNESAPWAEAVIVEDGVITFVGSSHQAVLLAEKKGLKARDLNGKLVLPGFIDTHAHPVLGASLFDSLVLNPMESPEDWLASIEDYAQSNPDKPFIFGLGIFAKKFGAQGPSKQDLDAIESIRPVIIVDEGGHTAWANSAALAMAGVNKETPDPIPGKHYYQRDSEGEPTGFAVEHLAWLPLAEKVGVFSEQRILASAEELFPLLSMFGITTVYEAGMLSLVDVGHQVLRRMEADNKLRVRMQTSVSVVDASQASSAVAELKRIQQRWNSTLVSPATIKIHNDGTTEAETSAQIEPYLNNPENRGALILEGRALTELVLDAAHAGVNVHIHSIGERAVHEALNAFQAARQAVPDSKSRFSTAHTELISADDIPRFAAYDVVAQTTPVWFPSGGEHTKSVLGEERAARKYRFRELLDKGGKVTFGSDFPVGGGIPALRPLVNIAVGMTRNYSGEPASGAAAQEVLTLKEMIRGYTIDAAYQLGLEEELGSIEVGKKADLVVLKKNVFEQKPGSIADNRVAMTVLNGAIVYERNLKSWITEFFLDM